MLKKLFIMTILILSFAEGITLNKWYHSVSSEQYGVFDTQIRFTNNEYRESVANKDWIAIYKKGTLTAWENVLHWNWVKDLACSAPSECHDLFLARGLEEGEYEVRYFKNNSYSVETSIGMSVKPHLSYLKKITLYDINQILQIYIDGFPKNIQPNSSDWVALYKVGSDNSWNNVLKWAWVKKLAQYPRSKRWSIPKKELENGTYEVRYFLNNSFKTYKKSQSFQIGGNKTTTVELGDIVQVGLNNATLDIYFKNRSNTRTKKDWIALFQSGKDHIAENIVTWKYLDQDRENGIVTFIVHPRRWIGKTLDAVLFKDGSYTPIVIGKKTF